MEIGSAILYAAIVAVIIGIVYFASSALLHAQKRNTPAQLPSPPASGNLTAGSASNVSFYALNVQYVYDGPLFKNGQQCTYDSYTYVDDSQSGKVKGNEEFYIGLEPSSSDCSMVITNITNYTSGFKVVSTEPAIPLYMPPNSQMAIQAEVQAPSSYFYGPLTITVHYK